MGAGVIVLAGGSGSRMGGAAGWEEPAPGVRVGASESKVFAPAKGRPLLALSLEVCALAPSVTVCVVVAREQELNRVRAIADAVVGLEATVVAGGASRFASEVAGLDALRKPAFDGVVDVVAIHDAARPFASVELFEQVIAAARRHGGAVPGLAFDEPVLDLSDSRPRRRSVGEVVKMQTPQAFQVRYLYPAYDLPVADPIPADTAETVERMGNVPVAVVAGDVRNLKVTFAEDLDRVATLADWWEAGSWRHDPGPIGG